MTQTPNKTPEKKTPKVSPMIQKFKAKKQTAVYTDGMVITKLVKENPKRKGSKSAARFSLYRDGMTVAEARKAGVKPDDFVWDELHNFVKIERVVKKAA